MRILCFLAATFVAFPASSLASTADADKAQAREIRSLEKDIARLEKRYEKLIKRCTGDERNRPDARACSNAQVIYQDVQELKRQVVALSTKG
jgi:polyhydroxyalkanoate synthesis regulator phasin